VHEADATTTPTAPTTLTTSISANPGDESRARIHNYDSDSSLSPAPSDPDDSNSSKPAATDIAKHIDSSADLSAVTTPTDTLKHSSSSTGTTTSEHAGAPSDAMVTETPQPPASPAKTDASGDLKRPPSQTTKRPTHSRSSSSISIPEVDAAQASKRAATVLQLNVDLTKYVLDRQFHNARCTDVVLLPSALLALANGGFGTSSEFGQYVVPMPSYKATIVDITYSYTARLQSNLTWLNAAAEKSAVC
jgi:hypothetical protein